MKRIRQNREMQAAIKKYNANGDMMASNHELPMIYVESAPRRFVLSAARLRKKAGRLHGLCTFYFVP
jgi:hypothetical protein